MKEKPADNRIFTGSDDPLNAEQTGNLIKSPEFDKVQKNRIKDILDASIPQDVKAKEHLRQITMAISLIRDTKDGELLSDIMYCRVAGYSHKKIAKTLMKAKHTGIPTFPSVGKATKFVESCEKEAAYRVKVALMKRKTSKIIMPGA